MSCDFSPELRASAAMQPCSTRIGGGLLRLATRLLWLWPRTGMKFCLEVGETERHLVEFEFNQLLGQLHIRVNRQEVKRQVRLFNEPVLETHVVQVGQNERWTVRIEKVRKPLFGQRCRVFLNERLYRCYEGL